MAGTTFTWTATTSSTWTVGTNWSPHGPPAAADTAIVPSGSIQINTGTIAITDLSLGGSLSGPTSGEGTISVVAGGDLRVSGTMAVWAGSTLSVDAASFVDIGTPGSASAGSIFVAANHALLGDGVIAGPVVNNGTIDATNNGTLAASTGGELTIQGPVSGTGTMNIQPGATLQLNGSIGAGETINFVAGAPETLILQNPSATISAAINGFSGGDRIEFANTIDQIITIIAGPVLTNGNTLSIGLQTKTGVETNYVLTDLNLASGVPATFIDSFDPTNDLAFFSPARYFGWVGGTSTDMGVAANWDDFTDGEDPSSIVPGPGAYAEFYTSGGTLTGSIGVQIAYFFDGGSWTLASGANLEAQLLFGVGAAGATETVTVGGGSTISADGYIYIGEYAGSNGTLVVSAGGVFKDPAPPNTTMYEMQVGTAGTATGAVIVTGADALVDLGLNGVLIGDAGGSGTVVVSQGGTFIAGTDNSIANNSMAIGRDGDGTVIVTGAGSKVEAIGVAYLAHSETGVLTVEESGTFLAAVDPAGLAGLLIGYGTTSGVGGIGMATVTTDGILVSQGSIVVGESGTQGELTVSDGGTVEVGTSLVIGDTATLVPGTIVGGDGTLSIGAGSTVELTGAPTAGTYGVVIGDASGIVGPTNLGTGEVTLSGAGAVLNPNGNGIAVGYDTNGVLSITQGATLLANGTIAGAAGINIGVNSGANGAVTVQGSGSALDTSGIAGIGVGVSGAGTLAVSTGGSVNDINGLIVGDLGGSSGFVSVSGGTLAAAELTVGSAGSGTLTIANAGKVTLNTSLTSEIGIESGAAGTVTVTGAGSQLQGEFFLAGQSGQAVLNVQNSGSVGLTFLGLGGNNVPTGGTATVGVTTGGKLEAGTFYIWQGSELSVDSAAGSGVDIGTSGSYVTGAVNVESGHALIGEGLIAAAVQNNGAIDVSNTGVLANSGGGTMDITGPVTGTGTIDLGYNTVLDLGGSLASSQTINFGGVAAELALGTTGTHIANPIENLANGDRIELPGSVTVTGVSVSSPGTITINTTTGTNYVLSGVSFATGATQQFFHGHDAVTGDDYIQMNSPGFVWTGLSNTNYANGANWQGLVVPTAADTAAFALNSGGTVTGTGSALELSFSGTGAWVLSHATLAVAGQPGPPFQPFALSDAANLTINGGTLNAGGSSGINSSTGATLTIEGGAQVSFEGTGVGNNTDQSGSLLLTGIGTTLRNVLDSADPPYGGYLSVGGASGASGQVTITSGATLADAGFDTIGGSQGGSGTVTVSGGTWSNGKGITVGNDSTGIVSVGDGTISTAGNLEVGANAAGAGALTINTGGTVLAGGSFNGVGINAGSVGDLIINAGGVWDATIAPQSSDYVFSIGDNAASGTLAAASGNVLVTGAGALLNTNGNPLSIGQNGGVGTLTVANGGTVLTGSANSSTGNNALAIGRRGMGVVVDTGIGSEIVANGFVAMGRAGSANVTIENGASMLIGVDPTDTGGLQVGGGSSSANNGQGGNGELTVTTNGVLTDDQYLSIGGNGVSGAASVSAGGTIAVGTSLVVGFATNISGTIYGGSGALSIGAGSTVKLTEAPQTASFGVSIGTANSNVGGPTDLATGEVTVSGTGALLNTNGNAIAVGVLGNGELTVGQGATVEAGTLNSSIIDALSVGRLGDGSVIVDGGTLLTKGGVYIGRAGTGNVLVENHGSLNVGLDGVGSVSNSALLIGGAGTGGGTIAYVGGTGSMQIVSNGTVTSQANVEVGLNGATGDLSINGGGLLDTTQRIFIGGSSTIATGGTVISASGTTVVAVPTLEAGDGSVDIGPGGTLAASGAPVAGQSSICIGDDTGASGSVTVHGAGALLSGGGGPLIVGFSGDGNLTVSQGASATLGTAFSSDVAASIGSNAGGTGVVTVTDAGSSLIALGQVDVGLGGTGSLFIENQASVFTGGNTIAPQQGFDVGTDAGAVGSVTVTGNQSLLSNTGRFVVGDGGLGSLSIDAGATVVTSLGTVTGLAGAVIGNGTGASGSSANVTGTGSNWQITGALIVGNAASGALNITSGATVTATTLDAGAQSTGAGIVTISGDNASLVTTGSLSVGDAGAGELSILNGANATIGGDLDIGLAGGSGNIDIDGAAGTLTLDANIVAGAGAAVLTIGPNSTLVQDNGGVIAGQNFVENVYGNLDPAFADGGTVNVKNSETITYTAYVANTTFDMPQGVTFTLETPTVYGTTSFNLGGSAADTSGSELIANAGSFGSGSSVTFNDALSTLVIGIDQLATIDVPPSGTSGFTAVPNPDLGMTLIGEFGGTIKDFLPGDTIVVDTSVAATFAQSGSVVSVIANGATLGVLRFDNAADALAASVTPGALVDQVAPCFAAGTRIATERGEVAVEDVRVGDRVRVVLGGGFAEVVWVGRREVACSGHAQPRKVWPVRVGAGAFGVGVPVRDVWLSPDHAVYVGGVLVPVKLLVNGTTITQVPVERVTYCHVELAEHDVLLAEGLPAESYLDMRDGSNYAHRAGAMRLVPDYAARMWEAFGCAPLVVTGVELERAREVVARFAREPVAA